MVGTSVSVGNGNVSIGYATQKPNKEYYQNNYDIAVQKIIGETYTTPKYNKARIGVSVVSFVAKDSEVI